MPDHIHLLLIVSERKGQSRTPVPTDANSSVSSFVSTFKRFCNQEYGENIWQARFYDHIIRSIKDYEEHAEYIHANPFRWQTKMRKN
ncbi:MAG: transposase [Clostridia bacterium]|nr:transposase [Clostridia bacterium]